jgi:hypothetical protein
LAFLISAVPVFLASYKLNKIPDRLLIAPITNEKVILKKQHSFFWIPLQYWAVILLILSALLYFEDKIWT